MLENRCSYKIAFQMYSRKKEVNNHKRSYHTCKKKKRQKFLELNSNKCEPNKVNLFSILLFSLWFYIHLYANSSVRDFDSFGNIFANIKLQP